MKSSWNQIRFVVKNRIAKYMNGNTLKTSSLKSWTEKLKKRTVSKKLSSTAFNSNIDQHTKSKKHERGRKGDSTKIEMFIKSKI